MATLDQLSANQRAIIELVLKQGKSYEELAGMLGMSESRVRDLARDALVTLAPISARRVDGDWRGQLADYVLGQQSGPEATATKGHLRRSEPARSWARSLLDSLETLYGDGLPAIPDGERGKERRRFEAPARPAKEEKARRPELSPEARAAVQRRRLTAAGTAAALLLLIAVLLWPIGVLTGDDEEAGTTAGGGDGGQQASTRRSAGVAVIAERDGKRQVVVQATLPPNQGRQAYEVWLYNSPTDAKSLGAQVTDARGVYQGAGPLTPDFQRYRYVDVSLEPIDRNARHSGQSVLRGPIPRLRQPQNPPKKGQAVILGQVVLQPVTGGG